MNYSVAMRLIPILVFLSATASAQQKTLSGRVVDESGQPLSKVNVLVAGTRRGTVTDLHGRFSIRATKGETLEFSHIGYAQVLQKVGMDNVINVQMQPLTQRLPEVVVTGYATDTISDYVGAASIVNPQSIEKAPNTSILQNLQGSTPGLSVLSGSGQPGGIPTVRVRGPHSISGSSRPLLIVDGSPAEYNLFNTLNDEDIESITFLKDAVDLAPYGMRGTDGVIVITTKSGKGKPLTTVHTEYGWSETGHLKFDMMNSSELLAFQQLVGLGDGFTYRDDEEKLQALRSINTDWRKIFFRKGILQKHVFTTSFGKDKTQGRFSLGYLKQDGISLASSYQKVPFSAKIDHQINRFLSLGIDIHLAYDKDKFVPNENTNAIDNSFASVYYAPPYQRLYRDDGQLDTGSDKFGAIAYDCLKNQRFNDEDILGAGNAHLRIDLLPPLFFRVKGNINYMGYDDHIWVRPDSYSGRLQKYKQGKIYHKRTRSTNLRSQTELTFIKKIGADHSLKLSALAEYTYHNHQNQAFTAYGLSPKLPDSYAAITPGSREKGFIPLVGGGEYETKLFSYFALGDYTYKNKYKLSANFRRDNSSKLPQNHKWASLWSVGALWKIKDERFLSHTKWIDELNLRGSYGTTGNHAGLPTYGYQDTYSTTATYKGIQTLGIGSIGNPDLKWELSHKTNIGLNFGLFNRVSGKLDVYRERISNLFVRWQLSRTSGWIWILDNQGEMVNKGIEFQLDADVIRNPSLTWSVQGNIAYNKNEVTDLGQVHEFEQGTEIVREGLPIGSHYLVGWAGVDPQDGAPMYYDKEGKKTKHYDPNDAVARWGTSIPPTTGGFGTRLDLTGGLYLAAQFTFALDYYRENNQTVFIENPQFADNNQDRKMLTMWQKPGDQTDIQGTEYPLHFSSKFIEDASFVRFRTLTLGWKLPDLFIRDIGFSQLELYTSVQNLYTWTKWTGFDPEDENNAATFEYPTPRIFSIGCNISF